MYTVICECCGKKFVCKHKRKHCSKECVKISRKRKEEEKWQLCCTCKNAYWKCSWSKNFTPVDGWIAEPTIVKDSMGDFTSYKIKECPEYIRG